MDTSKSLRYMGNRWCTDVREKEKKRQPRFKIEAVRLVMEKGYSMAEASRNLGVEYRDTA